MLQITAQYNERDISRREAHPFAVLCLFHILHSQLPITDFSEDIYPPAVNLC